MQSSVLSGVLHRGSTQLGYGRQNKAPLIATACALRGERKASLCCGSLACQLLRKQLLMSCSGFWLLHVQARHRVLGTLAADEGRRVGWASHAADPPSAALVSRPPSGTQDAVGLMASQRYLGCCSSHGLPAAPQQSSSDVASSTPVSLPIRLLQGPLGSLPPPQFSSLVSLGCLPILMLSDSAK